MQTTAEDTPDRPSPRAALTALIEGNARFVAGRPERPHQDVDRRLELAGGQKPFAAVLACSDSRVPVEILLDQGIGDLFVVRNAGQILGRTSQASLEFAITELDVSAVLVLGHESCGAVAATVAHLTDAEPLPGAMPTLVEGVRGHLDPLSPSIDGVDRHVTGTLTDLLVSSDLAREAVRAGRLGVAGGVYGLADGRVRVLSQQIVEPSAG